MEKTEANTRIQAGRLTGKIASMDDYLIFFSGNVTKATDDRRQDVRLFAINDPDFVPTKAEYDEIKTYIDRGKKDVIQKDYQEAIRRYEKKYAMALGIDATADDILKQHGYGTKLGEDLEEAPKVLSVHETPTSSVCMEAHKTITTRGADDYGNAERCMSNIAKQWNLYLFQKYGTPSAINDEDVCYMMVLLKMVRDIHKPKRDNLVDGIGYTALIQELRDAKK